MWGHFKLVWQNIRIFSNYTESQKKALARLRTLCTKHLGIQNFHDTVLDVDANGVPTENSHKLTNQLIDLMQGEVIDGNSPWVRYVKSLLDNIGNYLCNRSKAFTNSGYPNDPSHLLCIQLALWLKTRLIVRGRDSETLQEVKKWIGYLEAIEADNNILSLDERLLKTSASSTANLMIGDLRIILKNIHDDFNLEISRTTIKEKLNTLINYGTNYISSCFSFMFFSLQNLPSVPLNFNIVNINTSHRTSMRDEIETIINSTTLGSCLGSLARTESVRELFFPEHDDNESLSTPLIEGMVGKCHLLEKRDQESAIILHDIFHQTEEGRKETGIIFLGTDYFSPEVQIEIKKILVTLCCHLEIFARVLVLCKEAAELSGSAGDILLCQISKQHLHFLMASLHHFMVTIYENCKSLKSYADQLKNVLTRKGIKDNSWLQTKNKIADEFNAIENAYQNHFIPNITAVITQVKTIHEERKRTAKKLDAFITNVNQMMENFPWLIPQSKINSQQLVRESKVIVEEVIEAPAKPAIFALKDESYKAREEALSNTVRRYGYACHDVPGDGRCFYHAVAHQLVLRHLGHADEQFEANLSAQLPLIVAEYFQEHPVDPNADPRSREEILREIYKEWADGPDVLAISRALNITIVILADNGQVNVFRRNAPNFIIFLGYIPQLHYLSLQKNRSINPELQFHGHIENADLDSFQTTCYLEKLFSAMETFSKKDLKSSSQCLSAENLSEEMERNFSSDSMRNALRNRLTRNQMDQYDSWVQQLKINKDILSEIPNNNVKQREMFEAKIKKIRIEIKKFCANEGIQQCYKEWKILQQNSGRLVKFSLPKMIERKQSVSEPNEPPSITKALPLKDVRSEVNPLTPASSTNLVPPAEPQPKKEEKKLPLTAAASAPREEENIHPAMALIPLSLLVIICYKKDWHTALLNYFQKAPPPILLDHYEDEVGSMAGNVTTKLLEILQKTPSSVTLAAVSPLPLFARHILSRISQIQSPPLSLPSVAPLSSQAEETTLIHILPRVSSLPELHNMNDVTEELIVTRRRTLTM